MTDPATRPNSLPYDSAGAVPRGVGWSPEAVMTLVLRLLAVWLAATGTAAWAGRLSEQLYRGWRDGLLLASAGDWAASLALAAVGPFLAAVPLWLLTPTLVRLAFRELRR